MKMLGVYRTDILDLITTVKALRIDNANLKFVADAKPEELNQEVLDDNQALRERVAELEPGKRAPVQGYIAGIPWSMHLRAYDVYCKKYSSQPALIDLEGRNCRDGFGTEELDEFIPGWRDELSETVQLLQRVEAAEARVVELTRVLSQVDKFEPPQDQEYDGDWEIYQVIAVGCKKIARAVLATTPAKALERAGAVKRLERAARFFMEDGIAEDSPDLNQVAWQALDEALAAVEALGKEG